jgi:putative nucleotidyltransferase with HDIG domain
MTPAHDHDRPVDQAGLFKRLDRIDDLPTLPAVALEVGQLLQDYDTPVETVCETIEKDQAMVPRILKLVNSAFFGLRSNVSNISHAVVLLGFNTIRNAVVSVAVIRAMPGKRELQGFDVTQFWSHAVSVAVTSKHLAEKSHLHYAGDAFTAGLLHDVGKLVMFLYFRDLFSRTWSMAQRLDCPFYQAEQRKASVTHADIGAYLARRWQLPARLVDAIGCHHAIGEDAADLNLLLIVHAADIIANSVAADDGTLPDTAQFHPRVMEVMGSCLDDMAAWYPETREEIETACRFFLDS